MVQLMIIIWSIINCIAILQISTKKKKILKKSQTPILVMSKSLLDITPVFDVGPVMRPSRWCRCVPDIFHTRIFHPIYKHISSYSSTPEQFRLWFLLKKSQNVIIRTFVLISCPWYFLCSTKSGHYVPQLAKLIIDSKIKFNLKGISVSTMHNMNTNDPIYIYI